MEPTEEEVLQALLQFLGRVELKGQEAIMFVTGTNYINSKLMQLQAPPAPIEAPKVVAGKASK